MARVSVEDCLRQVNNRFALVHVAVHRTRQLMDGKTPFVKSKNKEAVTALREIAEEKIKVPELTESAIYKLRKHVEQVDEGSEDDEEVGDDFESLYKGEISKSGTPILPSKRARKAPEKIQVSQDDLAELSQTAKVDVESSVSEENISEDGEVSLDEVSESENQEADPSSDDTEDSNS